MIWCLKTYSCTCGRAQKTILLRLSTASGKAASFGSVDGAANHHIPQRLLLCVVP